MAELTVGCAAMLEHLHTAEIQRFIDLGFDRVYLHNVGRNQREWVEVFGRDVLPRLHR